MTKKRSVKIRVAIITSSALIIVAILGVLLNQKGNSTNNDNYIEKNQNSPMNNNVESQTIIYNQADSINNSNNENSIINNDSSPNSVIIQGNRNNVNYGK